MLATILTEVIAATDGVVVAAGLAKATNVTSPPVAEREDVVYVRDARNWFYRYSHLKTIDVQLGDKVAQGQRIGLVGKEGATAWSHLHFDIKAMQPSGKWGIEEGYAFLWEAYQKQFKPNIVAVARPHQLIFEGETVKLDGSRSWSVSGRIDGYEWKLSDGVTSNQAQIEHKYNKPGQYSIVLYLALQQAGVPAELHLYASTSHDFGVRSAPRPYAHWTEACLRWLEDQKLFVTQ